MEKTATVTGLTNKVWTSTEEQQRFRDVVDLGSARSKLGSSSGGVAVVAVVKETIVVTARGYTQPQAKRLAPPGATITKSVVRTSYWQNRAHYLEHSISGAFDFEVTGESEHSALVYLLSLAWAKYRARGGEQPCPWDMDVALF